MTGHARCIRVGAIGQKFQDDFLMPLQNRYHQCGRTLVGLDAVRQKLLDHCQGTGNGRMPQYIPSLGMLGASGQGGLYDPAHNNAEIVDGLNEFDVYHLRSG